MIRSLIPASCISLLVVAVFAVSAVAQRRGGDRAGAQPPQTIAQKTPGMKKFAGFLDFYWDQRAEKRRTPRSR